ncbi:MAG: ferritin-like domain-containing protein [Proteobacteria bacterium]|nr:MAG: ferritin-like domain-containing protein [Pseudomonadota bacterium]
MAQTKSRKGATASGAKKSAPKKSSGRSSSGRSASSNGKSASAGRQSNSNEQPMLEKFFYDSLKDIYWAEKHLTKALPRLSKAATSEELVSALEEHLEVTEGQIERLEQVFELLGKPARGKTCEAIQGIIAEGEEIMEEYKGTSALDAGLISSAQAVEHYEIARYGTLKSWAKQLGLTDAIPLLDANLQEEVATDQKLTALGEASANPKGAKKKAS